MLVLWFVGLAILKVLVCVIAMVLVFVGELGYGLEWVGFG